MTWEHAHTSALPHAILHVDADAFFASCEQALHPEYKGKPVITGKERGIVSAASYEAKALGIGRGTKLSEVKKICPDAIILPSDYETYGLFSKRMFSILRRFSGQVEEYGIDEGFVDLTGLRRSSGMSYQKLARTIKATIEQELGITVSVGLASTKVLAKIASKMNKPSGYTYISNRTVNEMLSGLKVENIWGVGPNTGAYMRKLGITTIVQFRSLPWETVQKNFTKPHQEIWHELNGFKVYPVIAEEKQRYMSVSKCRTFTPASSNKQFVFSQLIKNVENACIKARRHGLVARKVTILLRENNFSTHALDVCLTRASAFPNDILPVIMPLFDALFESGVRYRATTVVLGDLQEGTSIQGSLFEEPVRLSKLQRVYDAVDAVAVQFGKHTVHLGGSMAAHALQHRGERAMPVARRAQQLKGETMRKRLAIPMLLGAMR